MLLDKKSPPVAEYSLSKSCSTYTIIRKWKCKNDDSDDDNNHYSVVIA